MHPTGPAADAAGPAGRSGHRPSSRQVWLSGLPWVTGLQVHWWIGACGAVEMVLTSTHLPLCRATSW